MFLQGVADWLGPDNAPLDGFSWRGGSERDTTGILMWSEVFLADLPSGEKVSLAGIGIGLTSFLCAKQFPYEYFLL